MKGHIIRNLRNATTHFHPAVLRSSMAQSTTRAMSSSATNMAAFKGIMAERGTTGAGVYRMSPLRWNRNARVSRTRQFSTSVPTSDGVTRKRENIRNIAIIAHVDVGKTVSPLSLLFLLFSPLFSFFFRTHYFRSYSHSLYTMEWKCSFHYYFFFHFVRILLFTLY